MIPRLERIGDWYGRWRATLRETPATRLGLYTDDRHAFAGALLAAWSLGKEVVLPHDALPATVARLQALGVASVGELPGALRCGTAVNDAWRAPEPTQQVLTLFTTGSTGAPSSSSKTYRQLLAEVRTIETLVGARCDSNADVLSTVSHQHIYGLLWAVLWPVFSGRRLARQRTEYPETLEPLARGPSVLISSPAHLKRLPDERSWETGLQLVVSSGGPLSGEAARRAQQVLGQAPLEIYGSTETGGVAFRFSNDAPWSPEPGVDVRPSAEGTLVVRGPHLEGDEPFVTADRIELVDGGFRLLGRADRLAKIEEKRVSLTRLEQLAVATGMVDEARAVVLTGARTQVGLVGVLSAQGRLLDRKSVIASLQAGFGEEIERVAHPRRFRLLEALPHGEHGKTSEAQLTMLFAPLRPDPTWDERTERTARARLTVDPSLRVLDGHFPQTPVVPGVAQLDWAITWGKETFDFEPRVVRLDALKFQRLMLARHEVRLTLQWNPERRTLSFTYDSDAGTYSSGRVLLAPT